MIMVAYPKSMMKVIFSDFKPIFKTDHHYLVLNPLNIAIVKFRANFSKANFSRYNKQNRLKFRKLVF